MPDSSSALERLRDLMRHLRDPERGCPWDRAQDFCSLTPYVLEEAYEVVDAVDSAVHAHDTDSLCSLRDELGDLLLQVVFYAQIAEESSLFTFDDVADAISKKLITRHPHVFENDAPAITTPDAVKTVWEERKKAERSAKSTTQQSVLEGVSSALPAMIRAQKLQDRAARVGFDWKEIPPILNKLHEEIGELHSEIVNKAPLARIQEEMGDVLFVAVNLARWAGVDAETALRYANRKFERRFAFIEQKLARQGKKPQESSTAEMEALWNACKQSERNPPL